MKVPFLDLKKINEALREEITQSISDVVDSGWYILGEQVEKFEAEFAEYCGTKHCVAVANGLDALSLTLRAWKELGSISEGDEVIVPANTYIASILAIIENKLTPVLVEPDFYSYNIDPQKIRAVINKKSKVILQVHLYGQLASVASVNQIAQENGLLVLEDSAQAHGASINGKKAGNWGDASGFSFYPGKNLGALGDGGAITTNDHELSNAIRTIANYGSQKKYENTLPGVNSRLDEIQAAILRIKLKHLDAEISSRRRVADIYLKSIKLEKIQLPLDNQVEVKNLESHVWHLFVIQHAARNSLMNYLQKNDIQTVIHYPIPPHQQDAFQNYYFYKKNLPITEKIHNQVLSLPINSTISDEQAYYVANIINKYA